MARQVLTRPDVASAPYDVDLSALDTLTPDAIFAHYDGASAAGDFLPCVTYYTQDGKVFARSFPPASVAAGGSADVSFFPGLSQSPAAPATASAYELIEYKAVPNNVATAQTFAAIDYTAWDHLLLVVDVGTNGGSPHGTDLVLTWNSGITTYNYTALVNGAVAASATGGAAASIVIPGVLPETFGVGGGARLQFFFPYIGVYMPLPVHYDVRTVEWHGIGSDGSTGAQAVHHGIGAGGQYQSVAGGTNWEAISSITLKPGGTVKWEQGSMELYGITGSSPKRYP